MDFIVVCCLQVLFLGSGQLNSFSPKPIDSHRHATKIVIFALLSTRTIMVNKFEEIAGGPSAFPCINNHPKIHHEVFVYGGSMYLLVVYCFHVFAAPCLLLCFMPGCGVSLCSVCAVYAV